MHASLSEDGILGLLARHFPATHPSLLLGRGDDCAILRAGRPLCVSSDLFLEDIHFRRAYFTPEDTGYKALAVNVSDIAACGGRPLGFSLCLGLPAWADAAWLDAFFAGMAGLAQERQMVLAGGDLSRCERLHISVTVWGEAVEPGGFLVRGGSMPGDSLFVVGRLGWPARACRPWRLRAAPLSTPGQPPALPICAPGRRWTRGSCWRGRVITPGLRPLWTFLTACCAICRVCWGSRASRALPAQTAAPAWGRKSFWPGASSIRRWCATPHKRAEIPCTRP